MKTSILRVRSCGKRSNVATLLKGCHIFPFTIVFEKYTEAQAKISARDIKTFATRSNRILKNKNLQECMAKIFHASGGGC